MQLHSNTSYQRVFLLIMGVVLLAYLVPLGHIPLDTRGDEARRALVTAEMMISGDYLTPTINGEYYFNKPPLYNWLLAAGFKVAGGYSLFAFRLPVVLALAGICVLMLRWVRRYTGHQLAALVAALAFATNGRALIYDTLFGLIDLTFALVTYAMMMLIFIYGERQQYWRMFLIPYLLGMTGYMLKGLPGPACLAITLLVYCLMNRRFLLLFSWAHIVSIVLFFTGIGAYYFFYFQRHPSVSYEQVFTRLLSESTDRTVVKFGVWQTILHFMTYPFEMLYHFAPWLLLVVALLRKQIGSILRSNRFIAFNAWAFLANFIIYWSSPEVYARYLFPFLPLLLTVLVWVFITQTSQWQWQRRIPEWIFISLIALIGLGAFAIPFVPQIQHLPAYWAKALLIGVACLVTAWFMYRHASWRLVYLALALGILRIGFNWFVIDNRGAYDRMAVAKADSIVQFTKGRPLYLLAGADHGNFDGMSFLIATRRQEILRVSAVKDSSAFYISDSASLADKPHRTLLQFESHLAPMQYLVQFRPR